MKPALIPYRSGKKWGFCNREKDIIIECIYDRVKLFDELNLSRVQNDNLWGIIDNFGNELIPCKFRKISFIKNKNDVSFIIVLSSDNNKYGLFNKSGKQLIPFICEEIGHINLFENYFVAGKENLCIDLPTGTTYYYLDDTIWRAHLLYDLFDFEGNKLFKDPYYSFKVISDKLIVVGVYKYGIVGSQWLSFTTYGLADSFGKLFLDISFASIDVALPDEVLRVGVRDPNTNIIYYGLVDYLGNIVLGCLYKELYIFKNNLIIYSNDAESEVVIYKNKSFYSTKYQYIPDDDNENAKIFQLKRGEKFGYIDQDGEFIVEFEYIKIKRYSRKFLLIYKEENKIGLMNSETGQIIIDPIYEKIEISQNDVAKVLLRENWYFIGIYDELNTIKFFDYIFKFQNFWKIKIGNKYGIITKNGSIILSIKWDDIRPGCDNLFITRDKLLYGVVNSNNAVVIPNVYDSIDLISKKLWIAKKNGKLGILDLNGNVLLDTVYTFLKLLSYPFFLVANSEDHFFYQDRYAILDINNNTLTEFKYFNVKFLCEDLFSIEEHGKFGIINSRGCVILDCSYYAINLYNSFISFHEYKRTWNESKRIGILSFFGEIITNIEYRSVQHFSDELVKVSKSGKLEVLLDNGNRISNIVPKYGLLSLKGKIHVHCLYEELGEFIGDYACVKKDGKWGVINKMGFEVIECISETEIKLFFDGRLGCLGSENRLGVVNVPENRMLSSLIYKDCYSRYDDLIFLEHENNELSGYMNADGTEYFDA